MTIINFPNNASWKRRMHSRRRRRSKNGTPEERDAKRPPAAVVELTARQASECTAGLGTSSEILAQRNPGSERPAPWNLFNIHSPSLLKLLFVTLPLEQCDDWSQFWKRTTMWNDEPGDKRHVDHARGRRYAREAVAAIVKDGATERNLEMVVDAILERGFKRRGPAGGLCRQLSDAEESFLHELCEIAVEAVKQCRGMPSTLRPL